MHDQGERGELIVEVGENERETDCPGSLTNGGPLRPESWSGESANTGGSTRANLAVIWGTRPACIVPPALACAERRAGSRMRAVGGSRRGCAWRGSIIQATKCEIVCDWLAMGGEGGGSARDRRPMRAGLAIGRRGSKASTGGTESVAGDPRNPAEGVALQTVFESREDRMGRRALPEQLAAGHRAQHNSRSMDDELNSRLDILIVTLG